MESKNNTSTSISERKRVILEKLKETPIVETACRYANISRASYYRWREQDENFCKMSNAAIQEGALNINDLAESKLIKKIDDQNISAIIYWLKHNHPKYRERVELTGNFNHIHRELTSEEKDLIGHAIRLALPTPQEEERDTPTRVERSSELLNNTEKHE